MATSSGDLEPENLAGSVREISELMTAVVWVESDFVAGIYNYELKLKAQA